MRRSNLAQLKKVNDYADSQTNSDTMNHGKLGDVEGRMSLQAITIHLHQVSQMLNTGLGSANSSIKLSGKLVNSHAAFCQRTGRGKPGTIVSRTQGAFQYVLDSFLYQNNWLEQYKTRKETAMGFVCSKNLLEAVLVLTSAGVQHGHAARQLNKPAHVSPNVPGQLVHALDYHFDHDFPPGHLYCHALLERCIPRGRFWCHPDNTVALAVHRREHHLDAWNYGRMVF